MLNEEKIRLMTKAASFESGEGKKALEMNRFYKGDYISLHLILYPGILSLRRSLGFL